MWTSLTLVVRGSNWILSKLGEPKIFSVLPSNENSHPHPKEYRSRYWMELIAYIRNLPIRIMGKVPPIKLWTRPHKAFHPYLAKRPGEAGAREYDLCYMEKPASIVPITPEQFDAELEAASKAYSNGQTVDIPSKLIHKHRERKERKHAN